MRLRTKYDIGQIVYLITDNDQHKRLVTGITIRTGGVIYELSCGTTNSDHYEFEISNEMNLVLKTDG